MDWHKRITQARTAKNLKKTDLAKLVGVSPATVTMWESGKTKKIEGLNLIRVCDVLGISPTWLLDGDTESEEQISELSDEQKEDAWFLKHLSPSAARNKPTLWEVLICQFFPDDSPEGYRFDPEYELDMPSRFGLRVQWLRSNDLTAFELFAMRVRSLDMEPAIAYGDILVLNTDRTEIEDGSVYVLVYDGAILVRRIQRDAGEWWLVSDHPDQRRYARKLYRAEDVKMIGKVILRQTERI